MDTIEDWLKNSSPDTQEANKDLIDQTFPYSEEELDHQGCVWRTLEKVRLAGSRPEYRFAVNYLEDRVISGQSLGWAHEPIKIRMVGQTYTPDFVEWGADGCTTWYEVKGHQKLGSQDRASVKFRFTAALFETGVVRFSWAKEKKGGGFTIKRLPMQGKRKAHPELKGE